MKTQEEFIRIFTGLKRAYGQTLSKSRNEAGKLQGKSWIVPEEITEKNWITHLKGEEPSLGIIPINENNECTWGAIDIDTYAGFDHKKLVKKIVEKKLPLVVCNSKSGGAHVYLFVSEPVRAKDMQVKLKEIAVFLGYGDCEIFPKQIQLNQKGTGNFLNLPYNNPKYPTRYAFDDEGNSLELEEFINYYKDKVVSNLDMVVIEKNMNDQLKEDFKQAPPCLVNLAAQGFAEGSRNITMFQLGIYLRQRFKDDLENKLDEYNLKYFNPPLPSKEIQTLFKQVSDSEKYFYNCPEQDDKDPDKLVGDFSSVCEKIKCQTRKFGVGNHAKNEIGNMKKWVTENPEWEVTHNGKVVTVNKKQLKNHDLYAEECLAQADELPRPVPKVIWVDIVNNMIKNMKDDDYIYPPAEVTLKGQYLHQLQIFLENNKGAKDRQDVLTGMVYEHEEGYFFFKPQAFRDFLKTKRFTGLSPTQEYKVFESLGGNTAKFKISNNAEHCWKVPTSVLETEYEVKTNNFEEERPY